MMCGCRIGAVHDQHRNLFDVKTFRMICKEGLSHVDTILLIRKLLDAGSQFNLSRFAALARASFFDTFKELFIRHRTTVLGTVHSGRYGNHNVFSRKRDV